MKHPFNRMTEGEKLSAFRVMLGNAARAVFLGGAGVSTESGIPDFRSRDGLYHKTEKRFARYQPEYLLSCECLRNEPDVFFDYYRMYGEFLPKEAHDNARKLIKNADLLIIGGTSLQVGSAAGLARQFNGGRLVIINKSKTLMDGEADLVFHDSIGKILSLVNRPE